MINPGDVASLRAELAPSLKTTKALCLTIPFRPRPRDWSPTMRAARYVANSPRGMTSVTRAAMRSPPPNGSMSMGTRSGKPSN